MRQTFGPGLPVFLAIAVGLGLVASSVYMLRYVEEPSHVLLCVTIAAMRIAVLRVSFPGLCWIRLDEDGIRKVGLCGSREARWEEIGWIRVR